MFEVWCVVWWLWYVDDFVMEFTVTYCLNTSLREILRQYAIVTQQAHGNTRVNTSTLNNGNVEVLSEEGK